MVKRESRVQEYRLRQTPLRPQVGAGSQPGGGGVLGPRQRPRSGAASAGEAASGCALGRLLSTGGREGFVVAMVTEAVALGLVQVFCGLRGTTDRGRWEVFCAGLEAVRPQTEQSEAAGTPEKRDCWVPGVSPAPPAWSPGVPANSHLAHQASARAPPPRPAGAGDS